MPCNGLLPLSRSLQTFGDGLLARRSPSSVSRRAYERYERGCRRKMRGCRQKTADVTSIPAVNTSESLAGASSQRPRDALHELQLPATMCKWDGVSVRKGGLTSKCPCHRPCSPAPTPRQPAPPAPRSLRSPLTRRPHQASHAPPPLLPLAAMVAVRLWASSPLNH